MLEGGADVSGSLRPERTGRVPAERHHARVVGDAAAQNLRLHRARALGDDLVSEVERKRGVVLFLGHPCVALEAHSQRGWVFAAEDEEMVQRHADAEDDGDRGGDQVAAVGASVRIPGVELAPVAGFHGRALGPSARSSVRCPRVPRVELNRRKRALNRTSREQPDLAVWSFATGDHNTRRAGPMDRSLRAGAAVLRRTCARASTSAWTRAWVPSASTPAAAVADAASAHRARETLFSSPIRWGFAASHARGVHGSAARFVDERFTPVLETPEMDAEYEKLAEEIRRSPKKRQRFLLLEALRGTRLKPLIAAEHELLKEEGAYKPRAR